MFKNFFNKVSNFGSHHQALVAFIITFSIVCFSWGVEKLLEHYVFYNNPLAGYIISIIGGLALLWLTQHVILHVI